MTELKKCSKCGEEKPATREYFYERVASKDGLEAKCKACSAEAQKARRTRLTPEEQARRKQLRRQQKAVRALGGKFCRKCGTTKPLTTEFFYTVATNNDGFSAYCRSCCKEINRASYAKDKERRREYSREYRRLNPDKCKQQERLKQQGRAMRRQQAPLIDFIVRSKSRDRSRRYYRRDIERSRAYSRTYNKKNYFRYRERILLSSKAYTQSRRALSPVSAETLRGLAEIQEGKCFYCGGSMEGRYNQALEHMLPISRGGQNNRENLVLACRSCNSSKGNRYLWEWMPERFGPPDRATAEACGYPILTQ